MPSERVQRQIDRLLDEADEAAFRLEWAVVRDRARAALAYDPDNADARTYLETAERGLASDAAPAARAGRMPALPAEALPLPSGVSGAEPPSGRCGTRNCSRRKVLRT